jgi:hypothetical protein
LNTGTVAPWTWALVLATSDDLAVTQSTGNLVAAGPANGAMTANRDTYRYAALQFFYGASPAGADGAQYGVNWYNVALYGPNVPRITGEAGQPSGVLASDAIRHIVQTFCPLLNTSGVVSTTYPIPQLAFKDRTFPFDALLEINKYHLWHIGVWDNRTVHFRPYDFRDYTWEVRMDEVGTTFSWQGVSTENLFNGVVVHYTDLVRGTKHTLTPMMSTALRDSSEANPWNRLGIHRWDEVELSTPTNEAGAAQLGRARLAAVNSPRAPGTITVRGHLRDRAGHWQPAWKVRAGDTIAITNHPNDRPRLIHETTWDDNDKALTISVDAPAQALDALFDRVSNAVASRGLL